MAKRSGGLGSSLFKQQVDSEEVLTSQEKERLGLLKGLSRAIKEVQVMFANLRVDHPGQTYITDCRPAERLCAQFEGILRHGLKPGWFGAEPTFWPVVLKVSRKQAIQYIKGLQYAQTDNGRCRAWIRLAVNECSLESYINVISNDSKLLAYYYETHSFLRTPDMVTALAHQLIGLIELTFKLTVDTASLEFKAAPEVTNSALPKLRILEEPKQPSKGKESRRGKKVSTQNKENGLIPDSISVGGVSSEGGGSGDSSPAHSLNPPSDTISTHSEPDFPNSHLTEIPDTNLVRESSSYESEPDDLVANADSFAIPSALTPPEPVQHSMVVMEEPKFFTETEHLEAQALYEQILNKPYKATPPLDHTPDMFPLDHTPNTPPLDHTPDTFSAHRQRGGVSPPDTPSLWDEIAASEGLSPVSTESSQLSPERAFGSPFHQPSQESGVAEFVDVSKPEAQVSVMEEVGVASGGGALSPTCDVVMESLWTGSKESEEDLPAKEESEEPFGGGVTGVTPESEGVTNVIPESGGVTGVTLVSGEGVTGVTLVSGEGVMEGSVDPITQVERHEDTPIDTPTVMNNTNLFLPDSVPPDSLVSVVTTCTQAEDSGQTSTESHDREAVLSHDTLVNDEGPLESGLDRGQRSSRDHTPTRKGTNPFLDSDEVERCYQKRIPTNPFAEEDDPSTLTPSHPSQAHSRPVSFSPPLSSHKPPNNPFFDDNVTPIPDTTTTGNYGNRPHLQEQSSIDSMDTPTLERILPPVPAIENSFQFQSNETTPSISPVSFPDYSPETVSTASSQDLSLILEGAWEQIPYPTPLGPAAKLTSPTEDHFGAELSQAELRAEIGRLKTQLKAGGEVGVPDGDNLRRKVVTLQLRLQKMKETEEEKTGEAIYQEVFGHQFVRQARQTKPNSAPPVCEGCRKHVRGIIRQWYSCKSCGCVSHRGCLSKISRRCNQLNKIKEDATYTLEVCPEKGLTKQKFRCGSCTQAFNGPHSGGARLCDYSGLYHCRQCHLNDQTIIPARVIHNWDFQTQKVCSHCLDLLTHLSNKAMIHIREVNPHLYTHVTDLSTIESLREDLLVMKTYFMQCRMAKEAQLLQQLNQFLHFTSDPACYSLSDLQAVHDGTLLPRLQEAHQKYTNHIKQCPLCSGKGYVCELCGSEEVLYPFDRHTRPCDKCKFVFHKSCFTERTRCPRCSRQKRIL